eukprot:TRINITY_DN22103_c0_g1_i4.p1 TRINITY_DN22103_c0_g1~~TRINITY_DN22103_c0_g1_i4.p1  ORF type:complete len:177 (+),score=40.12 TRINITY_DN22103_c0_g1_i4:92-622(+)
MTVAEDGKQIFLELWRLYPFIKADDYIDNGRWDSQKLLVDTELIIAHRKEAGAPEPPPLEEMDLPEVPDVTKMAAARSASRPTAGARPTPSTPGGAMRPAPPRGPPPASAVAAQTGDQAMMQFAKKWKLDSGESRKRLVKLPQQKRCYVMRYFRGPAGDIAGLDKYPTPVSGLTLS